MKSDNHAVENAQGWVSSISEMVAALECDYDRLEELRDEREALADTVKDEESAFIEASEDDDIAAASAAAEKARESLKGWDEANGDEMRELTAAAAIDGDLQEDAEKARERIQEAPLSVQVRSGWAEPGAEMVAEEFEILLSTGGPALRIIGELDEHKQPHRAWLEYQDCGTPWTHHYVKDFDDTLLTFCQQFHFGE